MGQQCLAERQVPVKTALVEEDWDGQPNGGPGFSRAVGFAAEVTPQPLRPRGLWQGDHSELRLLPILCRESLTPEESGGCILNGVTFTQPSKHACLSEGEIGLRGGN